LYIFIWKVFSVRGEVLMSLRGILFDLDTTLIDREISCEAAEEITPADGLHEVLAYFKNKGIPMGIVTNGDPRVQNYKIDKLGIREYVETIIISEEANTKKPAEGVFFLAIAGLKLKPREILFIGHDPESDIMGSTDAGLIPVWIRRNREWARDYKRPKYIIDSLIELIYLFDDSF
jgi:FMN phosphatase YigB (HAD superfamily)